LSEGGGALVVEDTIVLQSGTQARADGRALISAAWIGWGMGLALGCLYLGAGLGRVAIDHMRDERATALAPSLRGPLAVDPAALAQLAAPAAPAPAAAVQAATAPVDTRARELDCLAQAVYFEARGESPRGQAAVATVIMNRVKNPHFPKTVCGVVYQGAAHHNGCQFSFACDGQVERVVEWSAWEQARRVAARTLSGALLRDVGSATHFHTTAVEPGWGPQMLRVAQVGLHVFYRLNPHAPPPPDLDDATDPPQLASRPADPAQQQIRLAAAVVAPAAAAPADAAAKPPVVTLPAVAEPKAEPAPAKAAPAAAPLPVAKTDTPVAPKPEVRTAS
jgi:spore germination cell wall hydrolase CwlJ-like protein